MALAAPHLQRLTRMRMVLENNQDIDQDLNHCHLLDLGLPECRIQWRATSMTLNNLD